MAGGSKSESKPKDMTPAAFKDLQEPFASVVAQMLGFARNPSPWPNGGPGGVPSTGSMPNPGGTLGAFNPNRSKPNAVEAARKRRDEGNPLNMVNWRLDQLEDENAQLRAGAAGGGSLKPGSYQPVGDINDILRGIPGFEGNKVAGLGANEKTLLDRLMAMQNGGAGAPANPAQDLLTETIKGKFLQPGTNTANLTDFTRMLNDASQAPERSNQTLAQFAQELASSTAMPGNNQSLADFAKELQAASQEPGFDTMSLADFATQFRNAQGLAPANAQSLEQFAQERFNARQSTGYTANDNNPFMQAAIEAAQRPTMQALEETLGRTLPGRFTQAGHFTQPGGSSAFDRAAAIATRGAGQTMGDIAAQISFASTDAERNRQFQAQEGERSREDQALAEELNRRGIFGEAARAREAEAIMAEQERRGQFGENARAREAQALQDEAGRRSEQAENARAREAQMLAAELERRGQFDEAARVREAAAVQAELDRRAQATEAERTRQQQAATQLPGVTQQEIQTTIQNLQAQALPRMIEELGIERGLEQFQNRMNTLLAVLGIGAGTTAPVIGQQSSSKTKPNVLGPALGAL